MLRNIRLILAAFFFVAVVVLFVDFSETTHETLNWVAKIQFLPALLAANFAIIAILVLATLIFGRLYCSIICPLGIMQDIVSAIAGRRKKNRFTYAPAKNVLRISALALFAVAMFCGLFSIASLIAPYSAFGRIASNFLAPLWAIGNNALASIAEIFDSYAFHHTEIVFTGIGVFGVSLITLMLLAYLSWKGGRDYCNTICPVGTVLGFFAKFSLFRPVIDLSKCNSCGLCARNCKAKCIDSKNHKIDYSRCVTCFDCLDKCKQSAISYTLRHPRKNEEATKEKSETCEKNLKFKSSNNRRGFFSTLVFLSSAAMAKAADEKTTDGGYAPIKKRKSPARKLKIVPAGAKSSANLSNKCTACQLCVSACPYNVLKPSTSLNNFMQPELSYENGYCDITCIECSKVCPTGAILPIEQSVKANTQIGKAVWVSERCIVNTDGETCDNCYRQCPTGAITMVEKKTKEENSLMIPAVDETRCIGCGACENLCPARPIAAIYVEGNSVHAEI